MSTSSAATILLDRVKRLRSGPRLDNIKDVHAKLQSMESDADKKGLQHLRDLYRNELDARLVIDWKGLYHLIEKISNRRGTAGNAPFRVILKNS